MAEVRGGVVLLMLAVEILEFSQAGDVLGCQFLADRLTEGAVVRRGYVRVVARRVDGRQDGEKCGVGIQLAPFGSDRLRSQGQRDDAQ